MQFCTKQLINISVLSKLRESAVISALRYTILNGIVHKNVKMNSLDKNKKFCQTQERNNNIAMFCFITSKSKILKLL